MADRRGKVDFCSAAVEDASLQSDMQPWIPFECLQLGRGRSVAEMDTLDVGRFQIVRERQIAGVQKLGTTPDDVCTISCCTPDPTVRFTQYRTGAVDEVFFLPARTPFDVYVPKDADTRYVSFRQEDFLAATRALDPAGWDGPRRLHVIPGARQADFEAAVDRMLLVGLRIESFPDAERVRWAWMQELAVIVTANSGAEPSYRERSRGYRICRQARAIMEEEFAVGALPSIVDLCRQVRVSRRALEYAFQDYVGASPLEYMRRCRLGRARAVLRTSDPGATTVTAVAMRWGFFHLGRFARDYARLFGELPSTTLGRVA